MLVQGKVKGAPLLSARKTVSDYHHVDTLYYKVSLALGFLCYYFIIQGDHILHIIIIFLFLNYYKLI